MCEPNYRLRRILPYPIEAGKLAVVFVFLGNTIALIVVQPLSLTIFRWDGACANKERLVRRLRIDVKVLMRCDVDLHCS